jgi:hypothetical protein
MNRVRQNKPKMKKDWQKYRAFAIQENIGRAFYESSFDYKIYCRLETITEETIELQIFEVWDGISEVIWNEIMDR